MASARVDRIRYESAPLSALLYATRGTYTAAVRRAQAKLGHSDVPASGEFILNAMEWSGASLESIVKFMGVSKQAVSQSVEMLVDRGYLERGRDPSDRRRVLLSLTERGHAAGRAGKAAIEQVDRALQARVGRTALVHARSVLAALLEFKRGAEASDPPGNA
jgi:DNA-binding MarR family transcriptional regulator